MKTLIFASRNTKEILRDPLNLAFGIGFPLVVLFLLYAIQSNIPVSLFEMENLAPGIAVFGLPFISLFSGMLIAKDRSSSFLMRLLTSPLAAKDFILGYTLPFIPLAIAQVLVCFAAAVFLGLNVSINLLAAVVVLLPAMLLFIGLGLLCGSGMNEKQVGGICGALLTNLSAWLSGVWFDLDLVGGAFSTIAHALPFVHAVNAARSAVAGNFSALLADLLWTTGYAVVVLVFAIYVFGKKMKSDNQ